MSLTYGSVCSGIEAATCAWHPLGWKAAFVSEIEAFPRAVLQHRWPEIPLHGDFTTIQAGEYAPIDLLVGGTPCQSFSVAGLRSGLADNRGNLALEYLRLADRLRPRWLVWENVPGVLSSNAGRDFGAILGGMVELGYGFAYRVLDAQFFGVAQRRRRVFVVGYAGDWRRAAAVLFERHSLQRHPAPSGGAGEGATPILEAGARTGVSTSDVRAGIGIGEPGEPMFTLQAGKQHAVSPTLGAGGHSRNPLDEPLVAVPVLDGAKGRTSNRGSRDGSAMGEPGAPMFTLREGSSHAVAFALRGRDGGAMPELSGDQAGSLRASSGGSSRDYVAFDLAQITSAANRTRAEPGLPASTLSKDSRMHVASSAVRRLTPRECERLQGFADDYTLIPWRKGTAPDGPRYKALGNSMAVPVMAWLGERVAAVEALDLPEAAAA